MFQTKKTITQRQGTFLPLAHGAKVHERRQYATLEEIYEMTSDEIQINNLY